MASLPLYGAFGNYKPLGIQAHSMIHKPNSHVSSNGFGNSYYGHHHHHSRISMDQQPGIAKLGIADFHRTTTSSRGSVGRFEVVDTMMNSSANKEMKQKQLDLNLKL